MDLAGGISKLHQRLGTTIIYVTHDQTEAMTLGTRIVVMKDGVIQQVDTPQNLYDSRYFPESYTSSGRIPKVTTFSSYFPSISFLFDKETETIITN